MKHSIRNSAARKVINRHLKAQGKAEIPMHLSYVEWANAYSGAAFGNHGQYKTRAKACAFVRAQAHEIAGQRPGSPYRAQPKKRDTSFYKTAAWKAVRYDALKRSNGRCQCCGRSPADGATLNVDHIRPVKKHPELALTPANLQVLCADCNWGKGNRDDTDWRHAPDLDAQFLRALSGG